MPNAWSARLAWSSAIRIFCPRVNFFILQARARGITTLFLVDGPLEWSNSYLSPGLRKDHPIADSYLMEPLLHDVVFAISPAQASYLRFKNQNSNLTFMSYRNKRVIGAEVSPSDGRWQFLITTAKTPYFNEEEKGNLIDLLRQVMEALDRGGYSYVLRIFDAELIRALPPGRENLTSGRFEDVLGHVECVIGTPSSVMLQSMVHGKPTATLIYRDSPLFYQSGWLLGNLRNLEQTLASMLSREKTRMDFQAYSLQQNLSQQDFYQVLEDVSTRRSSGESRRDDMDTLRFENHMLRSLLESPQNINPRYWFYRLKQRLFPGGKG